MCPDFDGCLNESLGKFPNKLPPAHSADVTSEKVTEYVSVIFMVLAGWAVWYMDKDCRSLRRTRQGVFQRLGSGNPEGEEMMIYA
jgi:hypothetical protein